ncbi:MAG: hypothetical protein EP307_02595 [Rhodobacteraceae bacterium]|nr:MAG: hypothetical protein EP307_02595 [Paracoccaceae bacterium]
MSAGVHIPDHERGRLHVFAVNLPQAEIRRRHPASDDPVTRLRPSAGLLAELTGDGTLDAQGAELLAIEELEGFGLTGYLAEGHAVDRAALARVAARLRGIDGFALILHSQAFGGRGRDMGRGPNLTHIASFDVPGADWTPRGAIATESAQPYTGAATAQASRTGLRIGSAAAILGLVAAAAILWAVLR